MALLTINSDGLNTLRLKLAASQAALMPAVVAAIQDSVETIQADLAAAAPRGSGSGDSRPIGDDAEGPLAESFTAAVTGSGTSALGTVTTSQPIKLKLIVEGRKEVRPVNKRALFWDGLPHPVMRSRATEPNDFVTPVLETGIEYARLALSEAVGEVLSLIYE